MAHEQTGPSNPKPEAGPESSARRRFLKEASKYAAVTPLAVATLMSTTLDAEAMRGSGHGYGTGFKKHFKHKFFKRGKKLGKRMAGKKGRGRSSYN